MSPSRTNITAVVLTLNEELNLPECLSHLQWVDRIVVVDSGSTDQTVELARLRGTSVYHHPWQGFAQQRNWSIDNTGISTDWILFVDADEHITIELRDEILAETQKNSAEAFYLCFKVMFLEAWVKYSSSFPVWHPRLIRCGKGKFKESYTGHGETWDIDGRIGYLRQPYIHYSFSKGLSNWFDKHNRLSTQEAAAAMRSMGNLSLKEVVRNATSSHAQRRRQAIRLLSYRVPGWPFIRFLFQLFVRGGLLDGPRGWMYCTLYLAYEIMIAVKIAELRASTSRSA